VAVGCVFRQKLMMLRWRFYSADWTVLENGTRII